MEEGSGTRLLMEVLADHPSVVEKERVVNQDQVQLDVVCVDYRILDE